MYKYMTSRIMNTLNSLKRKKVCTQRMYTQQYLHSERLHLRTQQMNSFTSPKSARPLNEFLKKKDFNSLNETSTLLNVQWFLSLHVTHIRYRGTIAHTKELQCLPNQLFQPNSTSTTSSGITQYTTKI